nr:MAG TPA: hypothetical protein [Caudoviricetes sp.]
MRQYYKNINNRWDRSHLLFICSENFSIIDGVIK